MQTITIALQSCHLGHGGHVSTAAGGRHTTHRIRRTARSRPVAGAGIAIRSTVAATAAHSRSRQMRIVAATIVMLRLLLAGRRHALHLGHVRDATAASRRLVAAVARVQAGVGVIQGAANQILRGLGDRSGGDG